MYPFSNYELISLLQIGITKPNIFGSPLIRHPLTLTLILTFTLTLSLSIPSNPITYPLPSESLSTLCPPINCAYFYIRPLHPHVPQYLPVLPPSSCTIFQIHHELTPDIFTVLP